MDDPNSEPHLHQKIDNSLVEGQIAQSQEDVNQNQGSGNQNVQKANQRGLFNFSFQCLSDLGNRFIQIQQYDYRKTLLDGVEEIWVEPVLRVKKGLLDGREPIKLILEERLDLVDHHPYPKILENDYQTREVLDNNTTIIDIFSNSRMGRILIVGKSGSGKTVTLMELSEYLINLARNNRNYLIPVVFHLSNWEENQLTQNDFDKWLIQELNRVYKLSEKTSQNLVYGNHLIVMLDGLDEIFEEKRRTLCIDAVNKFVDKYGLTKIVVCSREKEYKKLNKRLKLEYAVGIQPISNEQLKLYLDDAGEKLSAVKVLLQEDEILQELAKTPLMLNIIATVYLKPNKLKKDLTRSQSIEKRHKNLFDRYIIKMLRRRGGICKQYVEKQIRHKRRYPNRQTVKTLSWLAQSMNEQDQSIFYIERMQPSLLKPGCQKWVYRFGVFLISALIYWLILFVPALVFQQQKGITGMSILGGILIGLSRMAAEHIEPVETLRFAWKNISSGLKSKLNQDFKSFLAISLFSMLVTYLFSVSTGELETNVDSLVVVLIALFAVLFLGALYLLIYNTLTLGLKESSISDNLREFPNQGIWKSLINTFSFTLAGSGVFFIFCFPLASAQGHPWRGVVAAIMLGLCAGLYPGLVCVQHLILRFALCFRNKHDNVSIPLNLVRFLRYAEERIFLEKVGGGYKFIHNELQDYFVKRYEKGKRLNLSNKLK